MQMEQALLVATMLTLATVMPQVAKPGRNVGPNDWPASALCTTKLAAHAITTKPSLR